MDAKRYNHISIPQGMHLKKNPVDDSESISFRVASKDKGVT